MVTREGVREGSGRVAHGSSMSQCVSLCCSHVLARSLTCPRSLAPSGGYIICCFALPFPPLFGLSSARLSSSFRRPASKANCCWRAFTSSIHIILTAPQLIPSPPLLFPSAHYIWANTSSTLCSNTRITILDHPIRTLSAHSNASSAQSCAASALPLPTRGLSVTPLSTWRTQPMRIFLPTCKQHC